MRQLWLSFCPRDPAQLDAASVSSIQVVGVVEALIQNTDTLFPGGKTPVFMNDPPNLVPSRLSFSPWQPRKLTRRPGGNGFSTSSLSFSSVKWG